MESLGTRISIKKLKDASIEKDSLSGNYDGNPVNLEINSQLNLYLIRNPFHTHYTPLLASARIISVPLPIEK